MAMNSSPTALIAVDVQSGFDDPSFPPTTGFPGCEDNIALLVRHWTTARPGPFVVVRHDSAQPASPLHPTHPGNRLKPLVEPDRADLLVTKSVNSAFLGQPDLHAWLTQRGVRDLVICGIQTNWCVETTARMAGNLGYRTAVALDATRTFDLASPIDGLGPVWLSAAELMRATALNLQTGGFARVVTTASQLGLGADD
ncbi:MAG: isochorismatase family protein [Propionibacteriaceae bacterium]|jgi:nicotinamidase-related amidase|nr:isochorismatase family protein [Propionibacteriaceae bacterium]